ncbi:hypothetical protein SAMN04488103_102262 [Gemmobacter aquatilis]|uniref:Uncharacterized protein n=1 Tax=Gemmobacter aquatilis TaxID=933059 RepID=A0A1H8BS49_9RHOB|nr:hypothetical protein SAMN04488103_102262 [Gemmobacter aquatilis]
MTAPNSAAPPFFFANTRGSRASRDGGKAPASKKTRRLPGAPCHSIRLTPAPAAGPDRSARSNAAYCNALSVIAWVQAPSGALVITGSDPPDISAATVRS